MLGDFNGLIVGSENMCTGFWPILPELLFLDLSEGYGFETQIGA